MSVCEKLSVYDISKLTGHAPMSIYQAIERLGIQPEETAPNGHKYYGPDAVETLKKGMRRPRGAK